MDESLWTFNDFPTFLTDQIEPGDVLDVSIVFDPTSDEPNRCRIRKVSYGGTERESA